MKERKFIARFSVTNPLGMHARVCSKWIKALQKIKPTSLENHSEWAWIKYNNKEIPADSLFKLLETRVPCGAEFDLLVEQSCDCDNSLKSELAFVISKQAFEVNS